MRIAIVLAVLLTTTAAHAQWHYQGEDSAFGGGGVHIAATAKGEYGFGVRCDGGELTAMLLTPEDITSEEARALSVLGPKLLLRVDDLPTLTLQAAVDSTNGKLRVGADVEIDFAEQLRDAKRRVAAAASLSGTPYHETSFNVVGSTRAMEKLLANCRTTKPSS